MTKYCRTCGFVDPKQQKCRLTGIPIEVESDFCSKHNANPYTCEACGNIIVTPVIIPGETVHIVCAKCAEHLNSCAFCKQAQTCNFETDPSSLPKIVQQQIRQGNMVTVTQVRNPDRIRETCQKNCKCYDPEKGCLRDFNYCERMEHIYD